MYGMFFWDGGGILIIDDDDVDMICITFSVVGCGMYTLFKRLRVVASYCWSPKGLFRAALYAVHEMRGRMEKTIDRLAGGCLWD